jgi:hypothetical protein
MLVAAAIAARATNTRGEPVEAMVLEPEAVADAA